MVADSIISGGNTTQTKVVAVGNDTFNFGSGALVASGTTLSVRLTEKIPSLRCWLHFCFAGTTIAVDSSVGATSAFNFSGSLNATTSTITFDTSGAGSIFISGASVSQTGGNGTGLNNITFVTVSSSTITDLG